MGKKRMQRSKKTFNDMLFGINKTQKTNQFFDSFVTEHHILFLDDKFVEFAKKGRKAEHIHQSKRPVAVVKKNIIYATIVPGSSQKQVNNSVFIPKNVIKGLKRDGWFLIRYHQDKYAKIFAEKDACVPGGEIPAKYYDEIVRKMESFIERQVR
jgi:hypothetical protein